MSDRILRPRIDLVVGVKNLRNRLGVTEGLRLSLPEAGGGEERTGEESRLGGLHGCARGLGTSILVLDPTWVSISAPSPTKSRTQLVTYGKMQARAIC